MWICPDVDEYTLWNNPNAYVSGTNIVMVVNSCETAQAADIAAGLVSYADKDGL